MVSSDGKLRLNYAINSVVSESGQERGVYSFDLETKKSTMLRSGVLAPYGAAAVDDELYAIQIDFNGFKDFIVTWDMRDWHYTNVESYKWLFYSQDMSYDPWTDQIISSNGTDDGSGYALFILDFQTKKRKQLTEKRAYADQWKAIAAGKDYWYGITAKGDFYKIDKQTAKETLVGSTGVNPVSYSQSMIMDTKTQRLFWFSGYYDRDNSKNISCIYEVDPNTGKVTTIVEDPYYQQYCGAWSNEDLEGNYPGIATDFKSEIPVGDLTGNISFTAPATTWDGTAATGDLDYTLLMDGRELLKGKTKYGATVKVPVTVAAAGSYKFSVKFTNTNGTGRWARLHTPIGYDKPANPASATMTLDGFNSKVSWDAVTKSNKGAALDTSLITYSVVRYPDLTEVATDIKDTVFSETLTDPVDLKVFYYSITAKYAGVTVSEETKSNGNPLGKIAPPYRMDFQDPTNLYAFRLFDMKKDGTFRTDPKYKGKVFLDTWDGKDDWMISAPVKMEAGKYYKVSYSLSNELPEWNSPEKVMVKWGKAPTVEGMTESLLDTTEVKGVNYELYGDYIKIKESGDYYFGLHAVSPKAYSLFMDEFIISAPVEGNAPGTAEDIRILSNYDDPNSVDIDFNAPTKTTDGDTLTSLTRIEVLRDGKVIGLYNNPRPGKSIRCSDYVDKRGETYEYTIVAYNEHGAGKSIDTKAYVGIKAPAEVTNSSAWENDGEISVKWDAPATDAEGNKLNPKNVKYTVYYTAGYTKYVVADSISETNCKFKTTLENPNKQSLLILNIEAITEGGKSQPAAVSPAACGKPYSMPFAESCKNSTISTLIGTVSLTGDARWGIYTDASFTDVKSQDNDNGFLGLNAQYENYSANLALGKVDLSKAKNPAFSFYVFNIAADNGDKNTLDVRVNDGDGWKNLKSFVIDEECKTKGAWNKVTVPLKEYAGKTVQFSIIGVIKNLTYTLIDNLRVHELLDYNICIKNIEAPAVVKPGNEISIIGEIENMGEKDMTDVTVNFYETSKGNMELVKSQVIKTIATGKSRSAVYNKTVSVLDPDTCRFFIEIDAAGDQDETDNMSEEISVKNALPNDPVAENLKGTETANGVSLTWNAPKTEGINPVVTETFETASPWETTNAEGWALVDRDGADIGGANGITIPVGAKAGFYVLDNSDPQFNSSWAAKSGHRYLSNMYAKGKACDDWAISPELSGKAQTITFYARSYDSDYLEDIEMLYSTTDNKPESFKKISDQQLPAAWTAVNANVPTGAKYFAIRCVSNDKFMTFIDDITYEPAKDYTVKGYNVYRDGVKITETPVKEAKYVDKGVTAGKHVYHVTAVYAHGESKASKPAEVTFTSVDELGSETMRISTGNGVIIIDNASDVDVAILSVDGKQAYRGKGEQHMEINVENGIYVVIAGDKKVKVMVR